MVDNREKIYASEVCSKLLDVKITRGPEPLMELGIEKPSKSPRAASPTAVP